VNGEKVAFVKGEDQMSECEKWLYDYLRGKDWTLCDAVRQEFKKQGFKKSEFKKARKSLGIETLNNSIWNEDGSTTEWFWRLPQ